MKQSCIGAKVGKFTIMKRCIDCVCTLVMFCPFFLTTYTGLAQVHNLSSENFRPAVLELVRASLPDTHRVSDSLYAPTKLQRSDEPSLKPAGYESTKSPGLAVLLSAALPGLGQIYNESYWKVPVIWGLGGYWVYEWIQLNGKYHDFRQQFLDNQSNAQLKRVRDFYRDERDRFAWYLGALYFLNLLDAYVGASLYDFNVSPDLTTDGVVVPRFTASIRVRF